MDAVEWLVTVADLRGDECDERQVSVSARHEAVLSDGRHLLLLDDRGWGASGPPDIWAVTSEQDIVATTRAVVGPDEAYGDRSEQDMAADHWDRLAQILRRQGVHADAVALARLPHHVLLSARLRARIGRGTTRR